MSKFKAVSSYCWSLVSDGSKEENELCYMWIGLNVFAIACYVLVKLSGV